MKLILALLLTFSPAAIDLGDGACQQSDGQTGLWNGTTADDDGCVTLVEYEEMYGDPTEIVVSSNPELEPDAPTVEQVFIDPFVRAERASLIIE